MPQNAVTFLYTADANSVQKSAYLYKISSRSVERLRRYRDFLISNMATVRHLGFLKYAFFYIAHGLRSLSACSCNISSRSDERLRSYCKFQNFTFCTLYNGNLYVPAKFHHNLLNGCGDIATFRFPIWRPFAILDF